MNKTLKERKSHQLKDDPRREGLKKDNTRPPRNSVKSKINQIDFDLDDSEWYGDDDLPIFEKM